MGRCPTLNMLYKAKIMLYKAILNLVWIYGLQLCGTSNSSRSDPQTKKIESLWIEALDSTRIKRIINSYNPSYSTTPK